MKIGACGRIRTSDRLVRSQVLYPAELHTLHNLHFEFMAEREGFEPSIGFNAYTPLAGARLQPLGHLSILNSFTTFTRAHKMPSKTSYDKTTNRATNPRFP